MGIQHPGRNESLLLSKLNTLVVAAIDDLNLTANTKENHCNHTTSSTSRRRKRDAEDTYSLENFAASLDVNSPFVKHLVRLVIQDASFHSNRGCPATPSSFTRVMRPSQLHTGTVAASDSDNELVERSLSYRRWQNQRAAAAALESSPDSSSTSGMRRAIRAVSVESLEEGEHGAFADLLAQRSAMRETLRRSRPRPNLALFRRRQSRPTGEPSNSSAGYDTVPSLDRLQTEMDLREANETRFDLSDLPSLHVDDPRALSPDAEDEVAGASTRSFALATDMLSHHSDLINRHGRERQASSDAVAMAAADADAEASLSSLSRDVREASTSLMSRLMEFNNFTLRRRDTARPQLHRAEEAITIALPTPSSDGFSDWTRTRTPYEPASHEEEPAWARGNGIAPLPSRATRPRRSGWASDTLLVNPERSLFPPATNAGPSSARAPARHREEPSEEDHAGLLPRVIVTQHASQSEEDAQRSAAHERSERDQEDADDVDAGTSA